MAFDEIDDCFDYEIHEPEMSYAHGFCPDCKTTLLFRSVSYPGGRESKLMACTDCGRELGGRIEDDANLLGKMKGDVGHQIFDMIPKEDLEKTEALPEEPKSVIPQGLAAEDCPSLVYDDYWVEAERKVGIYPRSTTRSGKWLLFIPSEQIDEVWAVVKKAVEDGRLGGRAKSSTALSNPNSNDPTKNVICVYTYDGDDEADVWRVREGLRELGFAGKVYWKADQATRDGQYNNRGHRGVSRYGG